MASQVHPDGWTSKEGLKDEEAPPPSQESHLSGLTAAQIELKTSNRKRTISAVIMLLFCFVDLLGGCLFMPTFGALCQRAKGGPSMSLGQMLLYPTGALETEEWAPFVSPELLLAHKELDALIPCTGAPPEMDTGMVYPLPPWGVCTTAAGEATPSKEDGCIGPSSWSADTAPQLCLLREAHTPASAEQLAWSRTGNPKAFKTTPFGFSTSMNMIFVLQNILGGGSQMLWGRVADVMPLKILCHINLMGTLCAYVLMYVAGNYWNSFWGFTAGIVLNACCGGVGVFTPIYFKKGFPPDEGQFWFAIMSMNGMAGIGVGALIMTPFAAGRGENVFNAAWVGIVGTILVWILLTVYLVEPKKSAKEEKINETLEAEKEKKTPPTPALVNKFLWVLIVAMAFDAAGDEGTRIARGTILQNLFTETNRVSFQNILLVTVVAMVVVATLLTLLTSTFIGKPMTACLGAVATVVTQVLLMTINFQDWGSFLAVWYGGKVFGFFSSTAADLLMQEMMPENEAGKWTGIAEAAKSITEGLATLAMALTYDGILDSANEAYAQNPLDPTVIKNRDNALRGKTTILICVCISGVCVLCYMALIPLVPKKKDPEADEKKFRTVDEYLAASDEELRKMTLEETAFIVEKMMKEDPPRMPRAISWGRYADQREELVEEGGLRDRAMLDFKYMRQMTMEMLTSQEKMEEERISMKMMREWEEANVDKNAAKEEMGRWLADYLDDAGYDNWASYPTIYKAMFMNAFPPIDPLDDKAVDPDTADIEHLATEFLKVADSHIKTHQTNSTIRLRVGAGPIRG